MIIGNIGRIAITEIKGDEYLDNICICPHCGKSARYGNMFMISGVHGCPSCHEELSDAIYTDKSKHYEAYVRKANNHEYEPYR